MASKREGGGDRGERGKRGLSERKNRSCKLPKEVRKSVNKLENRGERQLSLFEGQEKEKENGQEKGKRKQRGS